ncbi:sensor histidine kinase [Streptomyces tateyamensis]|uniref:Sensor histidine kinase n=1 Tax=Streptomyces tateyamensis TaxID=565073 RepID=A0A2V4NDY9_9ACTN|nr:sensor histidine kinase [Streptomyces tateyamensis]PYC79984.1 sensor histidine kinase [Streptomyces tateyamensis]
MTDTASSLVPVGSFVHPALFYRTTEEYVDAVGSFAHAALAAGEPCLIAVPGTQLEALRPALADAADQVELVDMTVLGRNPGRILAALQSFADRHPGRAARIVGEPIWAGRTHAEILEATRHEALINSAFAHRGATILCPYDVTSLPESVVADARRTHPTIWDQGEDLASPAYTDPAAVCADCDLPLPEPAGATVLVYAAGQLAQVRHQAEAWVRATALTPARQGDLILAIGEATANSLAHGGGSGTLRLWTAENAAVVAEIRDGGHLHDPLAGRSRPHLASTHGGRGLWMIHQLCDLVEIRAAADGLTLRLHVTP